jgi:hypothetical protein
MAVAFRFAQAQPAQSGLFLKAVLIKRGVFDLRSYVACVPLRMLPFAPLRLSLRRVEMSGQRPAAGPRPDTSVSLFFYFFLTTQLSPASTSGF